MICYDCCMFSLGASLQDELFNEFLGQTFELSQFTCTREGIWLDYCVSFAGPPFVTLQWIIRSLDTANYVKLFELLLLESDTVWILDLQGPGCCGGFLVSMFISHLLTAKKVNKHMSSYQILRIFLKFLGKNWLVMIFTMINIILSLISLLLLLISSLSSFQDSQIIYFYDFFMVQCIDLHTLTNNLKSGHCVTFSVHLKCIINFVTALSFYVITD